MSGETIGCLSLWLVVGVRMTRLFVTRANNELAPPEISRLTFYCLTRREALEELSFAPFSNRVMTPSSPDGCSPSTAKY